jgi:hypothetical protein
MHLTLDEIRRAGLAALRKRLGRAGMIRFLQQFQAGAGDYAHERHDWVDRTTLADLKTQAKRRTPRRRGTHIQPC